MLIALITTYCWAGLTMYVVARVHSMEENPKCFLLSCIWPILLIALMIDEM